MAKIVAQTGAIVTGFLSVFRKEEYRERVLVDIGVLRFPEPSHPFIKVSTTYDLTPTKIIETKSWFNCTSFIAFSLRLGLIVIVSWRTRATEMASLEVCHSLSCAFNTLSPQ